MARRQREYDGALSHLASLRAFLRETCRESRQAEPAQENRILQLELALTEAASNVILHGFQGRQNRSITLTVEVDDDQTGVTLRYAGEPFDPEAAAPPAFDGSRESGFGLYLIRQCVDEVHYVQDEQGWCEIRLVQRRQTRHSGEAHAARD